MKIVRALLASGEVLHGVMQEDGGITVIEGDILDEWSLGSKQVSQDQIDKLLVPIDPPNVYAIGLNYRAHADEGGFDYPDEPVIFIKATTSVMAWDEPIELPRSAPDEVDYESEMALVIGKRARRVSEEESMNYVLGFTAANDVSARDCQIKIDKQWARAKSFDTFCPLGPCIQTELDPDNLSIRGLLNGRVVQDSSTNDMIFNSRQLVSFLSHQFTLLPGTVILTGTPSGVAWALKPQRFLRADDTFEVELEGVGKLVNPVVGG